MPETTPRPDAHVLVELGKRIKTRRNELGISQERLALRTGLHWTYLGQVERGQRNPALINLLKIAYGLELDAGELVAGLPRPKITDSRPAW